MSNDNVKKNACQELKQYKRAFQ